MPRKNHEMIVVLDFGGQYSQLIARRIRECKVYCEIHPYNAAPEKIKGLRPRGIVFSGGPNSVYDGGAPVCGDEVFELGVPVLGICYGMQLLAHRLGGAVSHSDASEYGSAELSVEKPEGILAKLPSRLKVWMSHGDFVTKAPPGFDIIASSPNSPAAAMQCQAKRLYAVQFHPEVAHTDKGMEIIKNFLFDICGCAGDWDMESFIETAVKEIKDTVGDKNILCALSGGVDSSVAAMLAHRAVGSRLTCVFVNHGFMRADEPEQVIGLFRGELGVNLVYADASERFMRKIAGVTDPETKRKIIGAEFIRVFEDEALKLGAIDYLLQGTLYPDVVESGTATAAVIKSHHNVGGLPEDMKFKLIEPLKELFKDEVRVIGKQLGLPESIVARQPFPGPGLAIRIIGEVTGERLAILRLADKIVNGEISRAGLCDKIWQSFAVLPAMRSVGVMGDERTYGYTIGLRIVESGDGMTADWARVPYEILESISGRIVNEVPGVNRVVYDITSKPPSTIEWE
jgi:GMP synthase (glutamine-hydrolysing)